MDGPAANTAFRVGDSDVSVVHLPEERLAAVMDVIASAKERLCGFFYMVAPDATGCAVRDALCVAARRGVDVEFGVDSFGSDKIDASFFDALVEAGGRFFLFSPRWSGRYLIRNHQKFLVADGARAVIGGYNLTDAYFATTGTDRWEDLGVTIDGPMAKPLVDYFARLKIASADGQIRLRVLRRTLNRWGATIAGGAWLIGLPSARFSPWARMLKRDLDTAQRIDVVSAYFAPGRSLLRRLCRVADRGSARLVMSGRTDNNATIGAARFLYGRLLRHGAEIHEYQPAMLHTKLLVIDDCVYVGSSNLDMRSLYINLEIMLRLESPQLASHMRGLIDRTVTECEPQTRAVHAGRKGPFTMLRWASCYFLVSVVDYTVSRRLNFPL